jgi:hypothetical protein
VLLLMVALTLAMQAKARPARMRLSIRFSGYTHDAAGARIAVFDVSNASPFRVVRMSSAIHYQSPTLAADRLSTPLTIYLPGNDRQTILRAPTNGVAWRYEAAFEEIENRPTATARGLLHHWFPLRVGARPPSRPFSSDWISP